MRPPGGPGRRGPGPGQGLRRPGPREPEARWPYPARLVEAWQRLSAAATLRETHPTYWLTRMVAWSPKRDGRGDSAAAGGWGRRDADKKGALQQACEAINAPARRELARRVLARRRSWLAPLEGEGRARRVRLTARTDAVLWLASPGPLEVGLALDHLYGFPVLPGSSLKGLALRAARTRDAGEARLRFGTQDAAGAVVLLDGLPIEPWTVALDVMTPHLGRWYRGDGVPDDTESPVPVNFLSIGPGSAFEVWLVARGAGGSAHLEAAVHDLEEGLDALGLGAKTAAGYGVFTLELCQPAAPATVPQTAAPPPPGPPAMSPQAAAMAAQIQGLRRPEIAGRLRGILDGIARCPEDDRAALLAALVGQLRALGLGARELRDLERRHPELRGAV